MLFVAAMFTACTTMTGAEPQVTREDLGIYSSEQARFRLVRVVADVREPWSFLFLPEGGMLVAEISGSLWRVQGEQVSEVAGLPDISVNGQGGLLDLALHPDFASTRWLYFSYADRYDGGWGTSVARGRLEGSTLRDLEVIFRMNRTSGGGRHFGSRMVFGPDDLLYLTIGDRGQRDRAQDPYDHAGTVIRLNPDGSVPPTNPFTESGDGATEVYSFGHRNAQGMTVHPETGAIWLHEHGPQGGDEINVVESGANYGWPVITYGVNYGTGTQIGEGVSKPGMEQPLLHWTPSIAPSGMDFYTGDDFPGWEGDLFVGALAGRHLRRVDLRGTTVQGQEVLLQGVVGRVRDVRQGPDGLLYLITDEANGGVYRLEPAR